MIRLTQRSEKRPQKIKEFNTVFLETSRCAITPFRLQRSLSAGLSPIGRIDSTDNLTDVNLQRARNTNHDLIRHSEPVMDYLFERVRHSHSMVILADARGVLMHTLGDLDFLNKAERVALMSGASWAENQRGINAIRTALAAANEVEIHGADTTLIAMVF